MLELDEGQLSRPVLRGRGGSNTSLLPGFEKQARVTPTPQDATRACFRRYGETWPPNVPIVQGLWIGGIRRAGKSFPIRKAAEITRGRSGRTRLGPDLRQASERVPASFPDARKWLARTLYSRHVADT